MPLPVLQAYIKMLPRLQAQEKLSAVESHTLGGPVSKDDKHKIDRRLSELRSIASGGKHEVKQVSVKELAGILGSVGLPIEQVASGN